MRQRAGRVGLIFLSLVQKSAERNDESSKE